MSTGGGLLDLVSRGKKDTFFTHNPKISFFHSVYPRYPAFTQEVRLTQPRNNAEWGRWVDFEIESVGDIMKDPVLLIDLPTWLPPAQAAANPTAIITDLSGVEFGYTQDVGILMIEKVQFFNDQLLIHEFWGQYLEWRAGMQSNSSIYGILAGRHAPIPTATAKAATHRQLRIYLPLLGNQHDDDPGLPMIALSNQRFRIRVHLKRLEEVIGASDKRLKPAPWNTDFQIQTQAGGPTTIFKTLPRSKIGGPTLTLETTQVYVPRDIQDYLRKTPLPIPFVQNQLCQFTLEDSKWFPVVNTAAAVSIPCPLDFIGAVSRLTVGVQSDADLQSGLLYNTEPPTSAGATGDTVAAVAVPAYIQQLRLNLGLRDRMNAFPVAIWRDVANYYKNSKEARAPNGNPFNVYTMAFGPADRTSPLGTFNMSRTAEAVLYVDLAPVAADPRTNSRKAYVSVYAEAWNLFEIKDGRGVVLFAD
jgi:hypothetical protein